MQERLEAPLFRGATKPVMFIGVPLNALVVAVLPSILAMMLTWDFFGFLAALFLCPAALAIIVMRQKTKQDDQYLNMWLLDLQEKGWLQANRLDDVFVVPAKALRHKRFMEH